MMKTLTGIILALIVLTASVSALPQETMKEQQVVVMNYYTGDQFIPKNDKTTNVYVVVHNKEKERTVMKNGYPICEEPEDMKQVSVSVVIQELGLRFKSNNLRIKKDKRERFNVPIELPEDVQPGEYYARITVSNDDYRRVKYREIIVV
ncbi:hypothetical protein JXA85_03165 [Candidatus Woesearchaeota archaeon]|nr:hypothetical protein [Candidatus Woesearchaeota archaeon]